MANSLSPSGIRRRSGAAALLGLLGVALLALGVTGGVVSAASVTPDLVAGNPDCEDLGYPYEYRVDPPDAGTYAVPGVGSITVTRSGEYFSWTSTFGMDAVIAKGGPNANVYTYDPESLGDTTLSAPANGPRPYGLSHISFCYDFELAVSKTATTTYTRTYNWTIAKSVTPATWNMFTGDSGTSRYTVAVDRTGYTDSAWAVAGNIVIYNPAPVAATVTGVTDSISGVGAVAVSCGVSFPYALPAGQTLTCTYGSALPDGTNRVNTAVATTTGSVGGGSATAAVMFGAPTTVVNASINVTDTNGASWGPVSDDASWTYDRTFACDADEGTHDNTATITETGQSASASVTVNCYALAVTKDADPVFDRDWDWSIDKVGDQTSLVLAVGQSFLVNYEVTVSAVSTDANWAVHGTISVANPAPVAARINAVTDIVSPAIAALVDCGVTFPYSLAAGGTLSCTYSADLPDAASRINTATATLQNYSYPWTGSATPAGTTDFSGTAAVSFAGVVPTETDECIDVTDDRFGALGTVCADAAPRTFSYGLMVGPYATCGSYTYVNIASFVTNDTAATGSDTWTVVVSVPCPGCTLTQGYWKTHSEFGPAPYDDTWALLPNGASTPFFLSGRTWYQVFNTDPSGSAYYILAHQYMAAKLNLLNGTSSTTAVSAAIAWSETFFGTYTPASSLSRAVRNQAIAYAATLDQYNNGLIGPGHCSE